MRGFDSMDFISIAPLPSPGPEKGENPVGIEPNPTPVEGWSRETGFYDSFRYPDPDQYPNPDKDELDNVNSGFSSRNLENFRDGIIDVGDLPDGMTDMHMNFNQYDDIF